MNSFLTVVGAGLAGSEAAWQAAERGIPVVLYEMRPHNPTPVHKTGDCAELVCSNSLGSLNETSAPFLLKKELRNLNSLVIRAADQHAVPAGAALAVDRDLFSAEITRALEAHPNITFKREELTRIPEEGPVVLATGPLTSPTLSAEIASLMGEEYLYFYDALSPIVDANSIDYSKTFFASRYGKGSADYLNCGMSREQYDAFLDAILKAEKVALKEFEKPVYFEGCMPIEELASRGHKTLSFGPMKPVGLNHPETGERYYAVVQLRKENKDGTAYNIVGFQTKLTYPGQREIFRMIPGLEQAEFFRYGAIHRNTYVNAPELLGADFQVKERPGLFLAGQIVGVEGYVESCAMGAMAGLSGAAQIQGKAFSLPSSETAIGALLNHVLKKGKGGFQPMNINFGLFTGTVTNIRDKKARNQAIIDRALDGQKRWLTEVNQEN